MRNELNHIERIEQYLTGGMNALERKAFEARMSADPGLKAEVDLQKKMVERLQLNAFKAEMMASHNELTEPESRTNWLRVMLNSFLGVLLFAGSALITAMILGNAPEKQPDVIPEGVTILPQPEENLVAIEEGPVVNETPENQSTSGDNDNNETNNIVKRDLPSPVLLHEGFKKQFSTATINASTGGVIETIDSKSTIRIAPNTVVTKEGLQVIGTIEIRYREYRNPAEMVLSGIPMTYQENGNDYAFNSAGMIEVRAYQDGKELSIKPGSEFTIDYNVTEQLDSCFFFALDDSTNKWDKKRAINFPNSKVQSLDYGRNSGPDSVRMESNGSLTGSVYDSKKPRGAFNVEVRLYKMDDSLKKLTDYKKKYQIGREKTEVDGENYDTSFTMHSVKPGTYLAEIRVAEHKKVEIPNIVIYENYVTNLDVVLRGNGFTGPLSFRKKKKEANYVRYTVQDSVSKINENWNGGWQYFGGRDTTPLNPFDVGRSASYGPTRISPNIVYGLSCANFGVYNCDQINRINATVAVKAAYKDAGGKKIDDAYNLAMINLSYNASFGFEPAAFNFEPGAETVLLLFTKENKVYTMPARQFSEMEMTNGNNYTFEMSDITDRVKTSEELRAYLGL